MQNIVGQAVVGDNLFGRDYEIGQLCEYLDQGEHLLMLAPRRVGKTSLMLELHEAPRENWDIIYVDLEYGNSAADCLASIMARLIAIPAYRNWMDEIPFRQGLKNLLGGLSGSVHFEAVRVDFKGVLAGDWEHAADKLVGRLAALPAPERKLLLILDEFPILVSRLLQEPNGPSEAEILLARLREMRQTPALRNRVHIIVGGSVGLTGVLRRAGLSALINDFREFRVNPWDRPTAVAFLAKLGVNNGFPIGETHVRQILDLLWDPVPYHLQLFFSELRGACRGNVENLSPDVIDGCFERRLAGPGGSAHLNHYAERLEVVFDELELDMAGAILGRTCRSDASINLSALHDQRQRDEDVFLSVLRELEADGYIERDGDDIRFRSNLLRRWWRRHQPAGETP